VVGVLTVNRLPVSGVEGDPEQLPGLAVVPAAQPSPGCIAGRRCWGARAWRGQVVVGGGGAEGGGLAQGRFEGRRAGPAVLGTSAYRAREVVHVVVPLGSPPSLRRRGSRPRVGGTATTAAEGGASGEVRSRAAREEGARALRERGPEVREGWGFASTLLSRLAGRHAGLPQRTSWLHRKAG
jgi:hypothetical protein